MMKSKKQNNINNFSYHLTNYLSIYLPRHRGLSTNTIKSYRDTFVLFIRYFKEIKRIKIENITLNQITKD